ncbi:MAG: SPFH domain-containing protein [Desulfobulbaceae bacterium]|nr:SPFH domain-containing protein [Desulfobulbaceae bacterium]
MGNNNLVFLEVIEWQDETGQEILHRIPEQGSAEIKLGAQLIVRESQAGILFYKGKACDAFGPGKHTLHTGNIPILTKILSIPWGMTSPLRAEVYLVNMKIFTNLKWGTRNPVAFRDSELGLIRLRAHGIFNIQVTQPVLFINTLSGTMGRFTTVDIAEYLKRVIVSRFNDYLGEQLDTLFNLPGRYDELSVGLQKRLQKDFSRFGMTLGNLYITSITPPPDVQQSIDDKSRLSVIQDMDKLIKLKAASAMEKSAESQAGAGQGMGMGMGLMMPAMLGNMFQPQKSAVVTHEKHTKCPDCGQMIPADARFCPQCGHQLLILQQCANCGKNLTPKTRFCPQCGHPADDKPKPRFCPKCGSENLPGATFCNQCGEKI